LGERAHPVPAPGLSIDSAVLKIDRIAKSNQFVTTGRVTAERPTCLISPAFASSTRRSLRAKKESASPAWLPATPIRVSHNVIAEVTLLSG